MGKFILFVLVAVVAYLLFKAAKRPKDAAGPRRRRSDRRVENMIACSHCGVLFPESESVRQDGKSFCCEEHRRLAR